MALMGCSMPSPGDRGQRYESRATAIDLFCGLGGWAEGFLAEGYDVIGFDIEARPYPAQLVLQDVLTLHGSEFKNAAAIVASPPCQEYSYMAMPWARGKQIAAALYEEMPFPDGYTGSRSIAALNALFNACFRIQREACEAAGRKIPMVVENVKGAQPWVGPAKAHFGSYYLWGDIESVGNAIVAGAVRFGNTLHAKKAAKVPGLNWSGSDKPGYKAEAFNATAEERLREGSKNNGGSWFAQAHNTESGTGNNPGGRNVPVYSDPRCNGGKGSHLTSPMENIQRLDGRKQEGSGRAWFDKALDERRKAVGTKNGGDWFGSDENASLQRQQSSKSSKRAMAAAEIAKIPFPLSQYIAACFKVPTDSRILEAACR